MERANLGLAFHFWKVLCFLVAMGVLLACRIILGFVFTAADASIRMGNPAQAMETAAGFASFAMTLLTGLGIVLLITMLVTPILGFVGSLLCLWVPKKSREARPLIWVSFGLDSAAIGLMLVSIVLQLGSGIGFRGGLIGSGEEGAVLSLLSVVLAFAAWILFMLFLRALSYYMRDNGTGDEAMEIMILGIIVGVGGLVGFVILGVALQRVPEVGRIVLGIGSFVWMIAMIRVLLRAANLISTIRAQINRRY
jgi:hypothetical protein